MAYQEVDIVSGDFAELPASLRWLAKKGARFFISDQHISVWDRLWNYPNAPVRDHALDDYFDFQGQHRLLSGREAGILMKDPIKGWREPILEYQPLINGKVTPRPPHTGGGSWVNAWLGLFRLWQ